MEKWYAAGVPLAQVACALRESLPQAQTALFLDNEYGTDVDWWLKSTLMETINRRLRPGIRVTDISVYQRKHHAVNVTIVNDGIEGKHVLSLYALSAKSKRDDECDEEPAEPRRGRKRKRTKRR
jgi:hypothetical protein